jgi:hypothetical protein
MRIPGFSPRLAWWGPNALAIVVVIGCLLNTHESFSEAPIYPVNSTDLWVPVGSKGFTDLLTGKPDKARVDLGGSFETDSTHSRGAPHPAQQDTKAPLWSKADEPIFKWRTSFMENEFQDAKRVGPGADTRPIFPVPYLQNLLRKISFEGNTDNDYIIGVKFSFKGSDWMNAFGSLMISVGDSLTGNGRSRPVGSRYLYFPEL